MGCFVILIDIIHFFQDIRNFFGPPKITKNTRDIKDEKFSKTDEKSKNLKADKKGSEPKRRTSLERQTSKDKLKKETPHKSKSESRKTAQKSKGESRKTPQKSKNESKKKEEKIIQIDSDEDENGNVSLSKKSHDKKRQSRDLFSDSDEEIKKSTKRKKKQVCRFCSPQLFFVRVGCIPKTIILFYAHYNLIGGVMVSVLASSVVDCWLQVPIELNKR